MVEKKKTQVQWQFVLSERKRLAKFYLATTAGMAINNFGGNKSKNNRAHPRRAKFPTSHLLVCIPMHSYFIIYHLANLSGRKMFRSIDTCFTILYITADDAPLCDAFVIGIFLDVAELASCQFLFKEAPCL